MGVAGGVPSRSELELARDKERANEREDPMDLELDRKSEPDRDLVPVSGSKTRADMASSAVRNWRIWSLRLFKSSRVIPSVWSSCEIGETWRSAIVRLRAYPAV